MKLIPTKEQLDIIETAKTGDNILIQSFAGAAKTSSCVMISEQLIKPSLMVCFNKSIADEGTSRFYDHVECRTMHSLAWKAIIKYSKSPLGNKLKGFLNLNDIKNTDLSVEEKVTILELVTLFCQSSHPTIQDLAEELNDSLDTPLYSPELAAHCEEYFLDLINPIHSATITHDIYLKMFQLSNPVLPYEIIYLDECLTESQLVKTSEGIMSIKALYNRYIGNRYVKKSLPNILSYNIEKEIYEYKPMLSAIKSEDRECFRVTTEGLNKIECTGNHPLLTQRGYVKVENIIIGKDYILLDSTKNQKSKFLLNPDQYQLVLGSFLGDGCLEKRSNYNTYRLRLTQGDSQLAYLKQKADCLRIYNITKGISGYTGEETINNAQSKTFILDKPIWESLKDVDARALAIWYMDDGSLNNSNNLAIHSNKFTYEEHLYLKEILENNFNLEAQITQTKGYFYFIFNKENGTKLLELIADYIHPDLAYKTTIKGNTYSWDNKFKPFGGNYITSIEPIGKHTVYDIEVADNHNFITTRSKDNGAVGCIVHNCQDSSPVVLDILLKQKAQLIFVGDPWQSIYAWRGAVNAFEEVKKSKISFSTKYLTESFRFTQEIADIANALLDIGLEENAITGQAVKKEINLSDKAIICRNNSTILEILLDAYEKGEKIYCLADLKSLWGKLYHIMSLYCKQVPKFPDAELSQYKKYSELLEAAEHNTELLKLIKLTIQLSANEGLHSNITKIKSVLVDKSSEYSFTLTTAHKSKGLEWEIVELKEDLFRNGEEAEDKEILEELFSSQTLELLYVAITRAKYVVNLPSNIYNIIQKSKNLTILRLEVL